MSRAYLNSMDMPKPSASAGGSYEEALVDLRGRFEVRRLLQKAIFGSVLLVNPLDEPKQQLVIKAVSKDLVRRGVCRDGTQVFEDHGQERRVLRASRDSPHRNLLALSPDKYQVEAGKTLYTALPYLAGGELFEAVEAGGAMREDAARALVYGVARGLNHLHSRLGFVHNDVSLENVLLTAAGEPVVCDFGLASVVGEPWDSRRRISGKLPYQAPEIYFGTARKSAGEGDVFSLGVTLFVLLAGIPPFDLPDPVVDQRYNYIQLGRMGELLALWGKHVAPDAVDLLTQMLAHDPSQRLTMREVLAHPWMAPAADADAEEEEAELEAEEEEEEELELDMLMSEDDADFVFDLEMETLGDDEAALGAAPVATTPACAKAKARSTRPATGCVQNQTASPDSVFSFEKAYRQHLMAGGSAE